jgi:hypothetical protein
MRGWLLAVVCVGLCVPLRAGERSEPNALSKAEVEAGWVRLFDGQTLFGWKKSNDSVNWTVSEGAV